MIVERQFGATIELEIIFHLRTEIGEHQCNHLFKMLSDLPATRLTHACVNRACVGQARGVVGLLCVLSHSKMKTISAIACSTCYLISLQHEHCMIPPGHDPGEGSEGVLGMPGLE